MAKQGNNFQFPKNGIMKLNSKLTGPLPTKLNSAYVVQSVQPPVMPAYTTFITGGKVK